MQIQTDMKAKVDLIKILNRELGECVKFLLINSTSRDSSVFVSGVVRGTYT